MPSPLKPQPDYGSKVTPQEDNFFSEVAGVMKKSGVSMMGTSANEERFGLDIVDPEKWVGDEEKLDRKHLPGQVGTPSNPDGEIYRPSLNSSHPFITTSSVEDPLDAGYHDAGVFGDELYGYKQADKVEPKTNQELATVLQAALKEPHIRQFLQSLKDEEQPSPEALAKIVHAVQGVFSNPASMKGPVTAMIQKNWVNLVHSAAIHQADDADFGAMAKEIGELQKQTESATKSMEELDKAQSGVKSPAQPGVAQPAQNGVTPPAKPNATDTNLQKQQLQQTTKMNQQLSQLNQQLKKPGSNPVKQMGPVAPKAPKAPTVHGGSFQDPTHVAFLSNPMMLWDQQAPFYPGSQFNEMSYDPRPNVFDNTQSGQMEGYGKKPADHAIPQDPFLEFAPADPSDPSGDTKSDEFQTLSTLVDQLVDGLKLLEERHPELGSDIQSVYNKVMHEGSDSHTASDPNDLPTLPQAPPEIAAAGEPDESPAPPDDVLRTPILRSIGGMVLVIENPAGSIRKGVSKDGTAWTRQMTFDYGFIYHYCDTESCKPAEVGADGDHIDCFVGPRTDSQTVFVINQVDPDTRKFDEHKVMLGFMSLPEAIDGYLSNYPDDWQGLDGVQVMSVSEFKSWLGSHPELLKRPVSPRGWGEDPSLNAGEGKDLMPELHPEEGKADPFFDDYPDSLHRVDTLPGRVSPLGLESKYNTDPWLESYNPMTAQGTRFFMPGPRFNKPNSGLPGYAFTKDH